jgi:hypothetical protein
VARRWLKDFRLIRSLVVATAVVRSARAQVNAVTTEKKKLFLSCVAGVCVCVRVVCVRSGDQ